VNVEAKYSSETSGYLSSTRCRNTKEDQHLYLDVMYSPKTRNRPNRQSVTGPVDGEHLIVEKTRQNGITVLYLRMETDRGSEKSLSSKKPGRWTRNKKSDNTYKQSDTFISILFFSISSF
jgi:hypothetical protein